VNAEKIYIVQLRNPSPNDRRRDPFWEVGSFGLTGCHASNLMSKKHNEKLEGARLAFAQGGPDGIRLVLLTPPIHIKQHRSRLEAKWDSRARPFRYSTAPVLVYPGSGRINGTHFTEIAEFISDTRRKTWPGKFSSRFRSNCRALANDAAKQLVTLYSNHKGKRCTDYGQARPRPPVHKMSRLERKDSYEALLTRANRLCRTRD
jgi:hypothetical protein